MAPRWGTERVPEDSNGYAHATVTFFLLSCPPSNVLSNNVSFFFLIITIIFVVKILSIFGFLAKKSCRFLLENKKSCLYNLSYDLIDLIRLPWYYFVKIFQILPFNLLACSKDSRLQASKDSSRTNLVLRYFEETSLSLSLFYLTDGRRDLEEFPFRFRSHLRPFSWSLPGRSSGEREKKQRRREDADVNSTGTGINLWITGEPVPYTVCERGNHEESRYSCGSRKDSFLLLLLPSSSSSVFFPLFSVFVSLSVYFSSHDKSVNISSSSLYFAFFLFLTDDARRTFVSGLWWIATFVAPSA